MFSVTFAPEKRRARVQVVLLWKNQPTAGTAVWRIAKPALKDSSASGMIEKWKDIAFIGGIEVGFGSNFWSTRRDWMDLVGSASTLKGRTLWRISMDFQKPW